MNAGPYALIRKVREPFGCLGNMSPHPIDHDGARWRTGEALFQALRFPVGHEARDLIRACGSPMQAKFTAKARASEMVVVPTSEQDLANMRDVLYLKSEQHPDVRMEVYRTRGATIVEDCTSRRRGNGLFWGAACEGKWPDGPWIGENWLGVLWMELRERGLPR